MHTSHSDSSHTRHSLVQSISSLIHTHSLNHSFVHSPPHGIRFRSISLHTFFIHTYIHIFVYTFIQTYLHSFKKFIRYACLLLCLACSFRCFLFNLILFFLHSLIQSSIPPSENITIKSNNFQMNYWTNEQCICSNRQIPDTVCTYVNTHILTCSTCMYASGWILLPELSCTWHTSSWDTSFSNLSFSLAPSVWTCSCSPMPQKTFEHWLVATWNWF